MNKRFIISVVLLGHISICLTQNKTERLELPATNIWDVIIEHTGYSSSFNSTLLIPNWVAYELTSEELKGTVRRPSNSPFQPDPDYQGRQPERGDYSNSGWDKGHLAPCADMKWDENAMIESFYFTNICPQDHDFNAKDWEKLEEKARSIAQKKGSLYIICGPVVTKGEYGTLGNNKVTIPDSFFKAFLYKDSSGYHSIAYLMPNKNTGLPTSNFAMSVNDLEAIIDLDLFTYLDEKKQESVEAQLLLSDWE